MLSQCPRCHLLAHCARREGCFHRPALVKGYMQLYSVDQKRSQALEAHAAAFSTIKARCCSCVHAAAVCYVYYLHFVLFVADLAGMQVVAGADWGV